MFPARASEQFRYHTRMIESFHGTDCSKPGLYDSSIYTYIHVYNRLPQAIVDCTSVSAFQGKLTQVAKIQAQRDDTLAWRGAFQSCAYAVDLPGLRSHVPMH